MMRKQVCVIYGGKLYSLELSIAKVGFLLILKSLIKDYGQAYKGNIIFT